MAHVQLNETRQQLLESSVPRKSVHHLSKLSDTSGLIQLAFVLASWGIGTGAVGFTYSVFGFWHPITCLAMILLGYILSFAFMGLHECVHKTAFRSKSINEIVANLFGIVTFRPPIHYHHYHYAHHRFTGDEEKDPELKDTFLDVKINTLEGYIMYLSGVMFWIDRFTTLGRHCFGICDEFYLQTSSSATLNVIREARIYVMSYLIMIIFSIIFNFLNVLVILWFLPSVLGQPFLRFYLLAEHTGCLAGTDMLSNTRTMMTNSLYARLAWNMPYHTEHHAWPYIPFYALPKLHEIVKQFTLENNKCKVEPKLCTIVA